MKPNTVSIIIIGNWNPRIFTPSWIKSNLLALTTDEELKGLVNFEDMDFAFKHDGIVIVPRYNSVEISIEDYDESKGILAGTIASKILALLPQTPIKALGVNIGYNLSSDSNNRIVKVINEGKLDFEDFKFTQVKQSLNREKYQVNIITDILGSKLSVNFNFHYSKVEAFDAQSFKQHYEESQKLLSNGK